MNVNIDQEKVSMKKSVTIYVNNDIKNSVSFKAEFIPSEIASGLKPFAMTSEGPARLPTAGRNLHELIVHKGL